jgi:lantibiotic biosynthesis protein
MEWEPVLAGAVADRAWDVVRAMANDLATLDEPAADLALFWAYAAAALEDEPSAKHASDAIVRFGTQLAKPQEIGLFSGLAGAGWIAAHLADDADDALAAIDRRFLALLDTPWTAPYDLVSGLGGIATYFLARGHDAALARIVETFAGLAAPASTGTTWRSRVEWVGPDARERHPDGPYDCGLAHGVPGVIAVLSSIAERGNAKAARLRDDALAWLDAQRLPGGGFPCFAGEGPTRAAWCYGDPGVALALARTALPGHSDAEAIARRAALRDPDDCGVTEGSWCHGAAGLAHVFARWAHATGDPAFAEASRGWLARALAYPRPATPGLLDGATGIGLVLLAAIGREEPAWDRIFACDIPGR